MLDVLESLETWRQGGEEIAIATVVSTWGSAPRPVGSKMVTTRSGGIAGSVSGGCVEGAVIAASGEVFQSCQPQLLTFGVADEEAWEVGLACGGTIQVFLEPFSSLNLVYETLKQRLETRNPAVLISVLEGTSERLNRKMILSPDGKIEGDLDIPDQRERITREGLKLLGKNESSVFSLEGGTTLFFETFSPVPRMIIIGAVHIAQSLVSIASTLGFDTIVIDPRGAFNTRERFTQATELIKDWPQHALPGLGLDKSDYLVVVTHDPKLDDPALEITLRSKAGYVGALGSRRTSRNRLERLREKGLTSEQLDRLHAPIGLPLGGRSAGEIAVSIIAEILLCKNNIQYQVSIDHV